MAFPMIRKKLESLGIQLPAVTPPLASYVPARRSGQLVFVSGQLPMKGGELMATGALDSEEDLKRAQAAIRQCFLNALAAAGLVADLDKIARVIRLGAYVSSTPRFFQHHLVANGASDLAREIFGEEGVHARFAVGVPSLPVNSSVELEAIFELLD